MADEQEVRLSPNERALLTAMAAAGIVAEYRYSGFVGLKSLHAIPETAVRRTVRALARKGMAEFCRGLCNEDGEFAGSGYALTIAAVTRAAGAQQGEDGDGG